MLAYVPVLGALGERAVPDETAVLKRSDTVRPRLALVARGPGVQI